MLATFREREQITDAPSLKPSPKEIATAANVEK
jgi:hypothetical protein